MRCTYCGSKLHDDRTCPKTWGGSVARNHLRCTYCGARDHDIDACPKRHTTQSERAKGIMIKDRRA